MKAGRKGLTQAQQDRIWEVRAEGLSDAELARRLGLARRQVNKYLNACGGIRPRRPRRRAPGRLSLAEREEISRGIARRDSDRQIARALGRSHTTIAREIAPEQISGWLRLRYPDNEAMQLSHETIYRSLYVQARGTLKRELTRQLRSGRQKRQPRGASRHGQGRGKIKDMVMISERPPEVEDRAVPGHWEGDLLLGSRGNAIATLAERQTRYCQLVCLPDGARAEPVSRALCESITTLPAQLRRSLTWDQGLELAEHRRFSVESGVEVYFCDPHSPWQRGSNENTNGLLRQYFPKGKSLAQVTQRQLDEVAAKLNGRPRKTLGFITPAESSRS